MATIYNNIPQSIDSYIPQLRKNQSISLQTVDNNKNIIYRSFKIYSFPNKDAKNIKLVDLGGYSEVYKASSYYEITEEFIVDTYSSTQELKNGIIVPSFRTWEHTTTHLNSQRQLANRESQVITWQPPAISSDPEAIPPELPEALTIQIGDVYGVTIPSGCQLISPLNLNPGLLINIDKIVVKPLVYQPLSFSFRGVDVLSFEIPYKIITDNPNLVYPSSVIDPPKVPPNVQGLNTNFPSLNETAIIDYASRRYRSTGFI